MSTVEWYIERNNIKRMNRALLIGIVVVVVLLGGFFALNSYINKEKQGDTPLSEGHEDIAYTINGKIVDLENGAGSVDGVTYKIVGEETEGDITEDGISDIAFLLEETKATSTDLFLVAAVRTSEGYRGTGGASLGDIEPIGLSSEMGGVVVRYHKKENTVATSTATTTNAQELERFFVVIDGELQSMRMPEL